MRSLTGPLLAAALAACSSAGAERSPLEASIPFVRSNGIAEWRAASDELLYARGINGRWYAVRTMGRCSRLLDALSLGFETSPLGELDRFGAINAEGQRCPISSIARLEGEPPKKRPSR